MTKKEYDRLYYLKNKEKRLKQVKEYNSANKEKIAEYYKKYYKDNKKNISVYHRNYYDEKADEFKQYYNENREKILKQKRDYYSTQLGRAKGLISAYKEADKKANRGECTLTAEWIVENIFSKPCAHCGKTGWDVIGCNRLDNDKPHTSDNVEPCCLQCNIKLPKKYV